MPTQGIDLGPCEVKILAYNVEVLFEIVREKNGKRRQYELYVPIEKFMKFLDRMKMEDLK